jgi:hypothetical protein
MKITTLSLLGLGMAVGSGALAQGQADGYSYTTTNKLGQEVTVVRAFEFMVTPPLRDWPAVEDKMEMAEKDEVKQARGITPVANPAGEYNDESTMQKEMGSRQSRGPIVSWQGMSGSGYPPDPSGAAGPDHYVQAVNTSWRVYDKTGTPVTNQANLSTVTGGSNLGDPIVMYDRHAERWFISQFQQSPNSIKVAISQTSDPTGAYYVYTFAFSQFPDYPKYSIWWDGYYGTSNSNKTAFVFERDKMIAGDPGAQAVLLTATGANNQGFRSVLPADADGDLPPNGTPCYFFNVEDNAWSGVSQDQIEVFEMTTDWVTPGNTSISSSMTIPVASLDINFTGGFANIAQPGTSQRIDAIQQVLMYRAQHMRWVGSNTVMLSCAVDLGSNRSGIRWWELRDANDGNWQIAQEGTYAPDATGSRWMSSIAMDKYGNVGMGYNYIDPSNNKYASLAYTGRRVTDGVNQMSIAEVIVQAGTGAQTVTDRFGDYGHLSLDPNGTTFWYTGEWLANSPRTRIFSFDIQSELGLGETPYYENLEMTVSLNGGQVLTNVSGILNSEEVIVELIGLDGKVISDKMVQPVNGSLTHTFDAQNLAGGIYFVRVGNKNFQEVKRFTKS